MTSVDDFKLLDPATLAEPYEFWSALRESAPIHHTAEGAGFTIVTRYDDVVTAIRDTETFSNQISRRFKGGMSPYEDSAQVKEILKDGCPYSDALAFVDGDVHAKHRRMIRRGFTNTRVRELDEYIHDVVHRLLDEMPFGEPVDFWKQFCVRLPVLMIGHILGVDEQHEQDVKRWADAQVARFGEPRETEDENISIAKDLVDFHQYLYRELAARRAEPRDDFLSDLVNAEEETTENELVLICAQLLVAGAESSTSLIGSMVNEIVDRPELLERLRHDEYLVKDVVEETLRTESPIKLVHRITTRDTVLGGVEIPADTVCMLMIASANRDDAMFEDAAVFDDDRRDAKRHLAFGMGAHLCSGAELARSEARIALQALLERTTSITRAPGHTSEHIPNLTVRALRDLKLVLR
ncbi:cytochrome P450 [Nocardia miyunensis]|uniref:cytochrome P450 n=1 Tax=Nocardia miyunensis TaxID=282684 RepID=UPI0008301EA0|nr:cytochrome P450 [Nocardia miyunensis]